MNYEEIEEFLRILKKVKGENLFNAYTDICHYHDIGMISPNIRSNNFRQYFSILDKCDNLLIGEAAGYIGCRRTGLAFTDEITLNTINKLYQLDLQKATKSGKNKEHSASQVWKVLSKLVNPPFLWNIVPFHPHKQGQQLTNRTPTKEDHALVKEAVTYFLEHTNFKRIFAIGKVAEKILIDLKAEVVYIRHPSYGGSNQFHEKINNYFQIKPTENRLDKFI